MRAWRSLITAAVVLSFLSLLTGRLAWSQEPKKSDAAPAEKPKAGAEGQGDKVSPEAEKAAADDEGTTEGLLRKAERHAAKEIEARASERRPLQDKLRGMAQYPFPAGDGYYYGPYYPWHWLPQTAWAKNYPPSITHVPRLGLQHNYPFAYQNGIHVPDDSDPLYVEPNLAPFVGVVGAAKAELAEAARSTAQKESDDEENAGTAAALALLKCGKYKEAGRILADQFQATDDPRDALLLSEVFFAMGKASHAEMLLRHALESDSVIAALPRDVSKHFSSSDEFEKKLQDLDSSGDHKLLLGYLKVHSKNADAGLDLLGKLSKENPKDKGAARLYRHYLGKAFQE